MEKMCNEEKPLDKILPDGGMTAIFRKIACIGDSLSSGEFERLGSDGKKTYHDFYEYSWGQFMARATGSTVYNFSKGGLKAVDYCRSFAEEKGFWNPELACQAYIIALGVNDLLGWKMAVGTISDVNDEDYTKNGDTFAGWYGQIIARYKRIQPSAKFFLVTMPKTSNEENEGNETKAAHAALLHDFAEHYDNTYVIDLFKYSPLHDDEFKKRYYLYNHLNPMGYIYTANQIMSYIDYIIRHDYESFSKVGFIGTKWDDERSEREKNRTVGK